MPYLELCVTVLAFRILRQGSSDLSGHKLKRCPSGIGALLALCGVPEFSVRYLYDGRVPSLLQLKRQKGPLLPLGTDFSQEKALIYLLYL